jgi:Rieske Fe-S protein
MQIVGTAVLLESCSSLPMIKVNPQNKVLKVPVKDFTDKSNLLVVRSKTLENDILLVKNENKYRALYLKCTHEGVGLTATDKKIYCTAHGSVFDFEGNVVKEPALRPLTQLPTEADNENIIIHLS